MTEASIGLSPRDRIYANISKWLAKRADRGFDADHDDADNIHQELVKAACCYALGNLDNWPKQWDASFYEPSGDRIKDLERAASLIVAEIERLKRLQ